MRLKISSEPPTKPLLISLGDKRAVSQKGGFGECALVLVFFSGEHPNVPSFRFFRSRGNIRQNHPFGNQPFVNPRGTPVFCGEFQRSRLKISNEIEVRAGLKISSEIEIFNLWALRVEGPRNSQSLAVKEFRFSRVHKRMKCTL